MCALHRRNADGNVVTLAAEQTDAPFKIVAPEDGAKFDLVDGVGGQRIVFRVSGNPPEFRLWWFVDGKTCGVTDGESPFVMELEAGERTVVAVDAKGRSATLAITISKL
jgi:membrane carboxypeptidase/penicillin-binding protein PbpC